MTTVFVHLLLGWGMRVLAVGCISAFGAPAHAILDFDPAEMDLETLRRTELLADVDASCPATLIQADLGDLAKRSPARILVIEEVKTTRELYTAYLHSIRSAPLLAAMIKANDFLQQKVLDRAGDANPLWPDEMKKRVNELVMSFAATGQLAELFLPEKLEGLSQVEGGKQVSPVEPPPRLFVYSVSDFAQATTAMEWAESQGTYFDMVVTAGLFPEKQQEEEGPPTLADLFATPAQKILAKSQKPVGVPIFPFVETMRKIEPRTRIVVSSLWEEWQIRAMAVPRSNSSVDAWIVFPVTSDSLLVELWQAIRTNARSSTP